MIDSLAINQKHVVHIDKSDQMASPTTENRSSVRRIIALTGVDTKQLRQSPFEALCLSTNRFTLSEPNNRKDVQPLYRADSVYAAALAHEIRVRGTDGGALIFTSSSVIQAAAQNVLAQFVLPDYSVITTLEQIAEMGKRNLILDLSAASSGSPLLGSRRVAGFVQSSQKPNKHFLDMVTHVMTFERIRSISVECSDPSAKSEPIRLITAGGRLGRNHASSLVLSSGYFQQLADSYKRDIISPDIPPATPTTGFLTPYDTDAIASMVGRDGSLLDMIVHGNTLLGFVMGFVDSTNLPPHALRLLNALEATGVLPEGRFGFVDTLQITEAGKMYGAVLGEQFFRYLEKSVLQAAADAGLSHIVCQTREFPYPNNLARTFYQMYGWKDSGVSIIYPYHEGTDGWEHLLARIHIKALNPGGI